MTPAAPPYPIIVVGKDARRPTDKGHVNRDLLAAVLAHLVKSLRVPFPADLLARTWLDQSDLAGYDAGRMVPFRGAACALCEAG